MAGFIGSFFTAPSITSWYQTINKPFFTPPNYVFAPVWTTLYILMGIALFMVWQKKNSGKNKLQILAIELFFIQLFVNIFWSIAFFGLHSPILAMVVLIALWVLVFETIRYFAKINKTASYLLYPYIAWASFAGILNLFIVLLNF